MKTSHLMLALAAGAALAGTAQAGDEDRDVRVHVVEKTPCPIVEMKGDGADHLQGLGMKVQKRGFLGVEITSLTPELRSHFGVSEDEGVMIGKIVDDSAAFRAGLQVGDIITRVGDETIEGAWDLTAAIRGSGGGETVMIEYWRDGAVNQQSVVLDARETCTFDMSGIATSLEELHEVLPGLHLRGLEISEEAMEEVMESLRGIDWEEHLHKLEAIRVEDLDIRMEELHERMEELGERLGREGERIRIEQIRVLEDAEREQLEREIEVRTELNRARIEARREATEAALRAAEARAELHEAARARAEARIEAETVIREAAKAAEEAKSEGGGGDAI